MNLLSEFVACNGYLPHGTASPGIPRCSGRWSAPTRSSPCRTSRFRSRSWSTSRRQGLAVALESIGAGFIATDREGRVIRLNTVSERVTGWSESEANGRPYYEVFVREDRQAEVAAMNPVDYMIESGVTVDTRFDIIPTSRGGVRTPVEARAALTRAGRSPVMVVDDDPIAIAVMRESLRSIGIESVCFTDARQALDEIDLHRPEEIVLDLMMPVVDGFAVLDALSRMPAWRDIPVFIGTSMILTDEEYAKLRILPRRSSAKAAARWRRCWKSSVVAIARRRLRRPRPGSDDDAGPCSRRRRHRDQRRAGELRAGRRGLRRRERARCRQGADEHRARRARPHPDGHPDAGREWRRPDAPTEGRPGDPSHPDHRSSPSPPTR